MRVLPLLLLLILSAPAFSQPVLTVTDASKANPVAPYVYYLEDFTHKLTYEQVSHFPLDSFQALRQKEIVQLIYRAGTIWLRLAVKNQTDDELLLLSRPRRYLRCDVYVRDEAGKLKVHQVGALQPLTKRYTPKAQIIVSLGQQPQQVYIALQTTDSIGDYLYVANGGKAIKDRTDTSFWQGLALGTFLLFFVYALIFFWRLRDPLIGWYALFIFGLIQFFLDFYGYWHELIGHRYHTDVRLYYFSHPVFQLCWTLLYIKFLNLRHTARLLYYVEVGIIFLTCFDQVIQIGSHQLQGIRYSPVGTLLFWIGADWGKYYTFDFFVKLVCLIHVIGKRFKGLGWYVLGLACSLISMIIGMLALYNLPWLPYLPYNNAWVVGNLLEIAIIGYALAERTNKERRQQAVTQQQLIAQLEENLRQKDKLLRIRDEIARDLHDEVGATLTSIAISTKLVQKKVNGHQPDIQPILDQIKADSEETIHSLRDTVWALNPDNDAPEKFLERLRTVAVQLLANQTITLDFNCGINTRDLPAFGMEQRRNIYLVFKEALHNIVKHAQASQVQIQIRRKEDQLQISIADNGQGFDTGNQTSGNGLSNFEKRSAEGGFSVQVNSAAGNGTTVEMQVPVNLSQSSTLAHPVTSQLQINSLSNFLNVNTTKIGDTA